MERTTTYQASAPVRLDFAGGWTDVAPFAVRERGVVVNAAIALRARVELALGGDRYLLQSEDLGQIEELGGLGEQRSTSRLDLLKAALRGSGLGPCALRTRSDVPLGSGLGSSGALDVALMAALDAARDVHRTPQELAEAGFRLETVEAGLPGGRQDQYAAALGGFHRLVFDRGETVAQPLPLSPDFATELAKQTVVCYTGTSRVSSRTIARVMMGYQRGDAPVVDALRALADTAERMAEAMSAGDLARVGALLTKNWAHQQRLDAGMCTESMARVEAALRVAGAVGGKAAGAGAGGCMFFVLGGDRAGAVRAAEEAGARVIPFEWSPEGVRVEQGG